MTTTTTDVTAIAPFSHEEAMRLQTRELERAIALLTSLEPGEWTARTDCPVWDVCAMYQHVLGACEAGASLRENLHQMLRGRAHRKRFGGPLEAALSAVQVQERADLSPAEIIERLSAIAPKTIRGRTRLPALVRDRARLFVDGPVNETWHLGYLIDTIYVRDFWMHRVDATRAVSRPIQLSVGHDDRIIADVVAEWARRHDKPFLLDLTGPVGGSFAHRARPLPPSSRSERARNGISNQPIFNPQS